ncbi:MAG: carboxypeptidase regulatory-like domain-containing protein [Coriobacteriales bacterium]|jgi:Fe-S-cluster-containing dehydrogenase component|nr:carboxypeptidase regulatory-like domain-containing protein [Coriobacteriales bacterium]
MAKVFVIDYRSCVGCHDCQIGCKDEHCGNEWAPYARAQPFVGQFWMKVDQQERGRRPHIKVTHLPTLCQHCDDAPCIKAAPDAVYKRDDGLVIIDPKKAVGNERLARSCPYGAIFWNEELRLPQKCTGCAHLLDGGHTIDVPRCVDNCHVNVIQFGEEGDFDLSDCEVMHPEYGTSPRVYYRGGLPRKFVAGTVYDPVAKEVHVGATVALVGEAGAFTAVTDDWGDFWLRDLPDADFTLTIEADGKAKTLEVSTRKEDVGLGDIALT